MDGKAPAIAPCWEPLSPPGRRVEVAHVPLRSIPDVEPDSWMGGSVDFSALRAPLKRRMSRATPMQGFGCSMRVLGSERRVKMANNALWLLRSVWKDFQCVELVAKRRTQLRLRDDRNLFSSARQTLPHRAPTSLGGPRTGRLPGWVSGGGGTHLILAATQRYGNEL
jgi:hypothetical protein